MCVISQWVYRTEDVFRGLGCVKCTMTLLFCLFYLQQSKANELAELPFTNERTNERTCEDLNLFFGLLKSSNVSCCRRVAYGNQLLHTSFKYCLNMFDLREMPNLLMRANVQLRFGLVCTVGNCGSNNTP